MSEHSLSCKSSDFFITKSLVHCGEKGLYIEHDTDVEIKYCPVCGGKLDE